MSTDEPVPVCTSCEKVDLEIQRQDSEDYMLMLTVICFLGDAEQNIYIFCAVSQTDCRMESVVLGKPILRWWYRNAVLVGFWAFVITEAFLTTCKKCRKLKAP